MPDLLIPIRDLKNFWKIQPTGVVHVGAHEGEELDEYCKYGFGSVIWIEAQPELAANLSRRVSPPSRVLQALVWNVDGVSMTLNVTNNGQSSSVFSFGTHAVDYPDIIVETATPLRSQRLDSVLPRDIGANFLNLDIQGAEYEALEGLGNRIDEFDYIYTEVNRAEVYHGIRQVGQIDDYLERFGFVRVATTWTRANWGDALYLRAERPGVDLRGIKPKLKVMMLLYSLRLLMRKVRSLAFILYPLNRFSRSNLNKVQ
jgi:FkbM family methyltransferase